MSTYRLFGLLIDQDESPSSPKAESATMGQTSGQPLDAGYLAPSFQFVIDNLVDPLVGNVPYPDLLVIAYGQPFSTLLSSNCRTYLHWQGILRPARMQGY